MDHAEAVQPFRFVTHLTLTELTGRRAHDLIDLLRHLKTAPLPIIYYHTHHFLERHQTLTPIPPNDFAFWVTHILQEGSLGERLAAVDTVQFTRLEDLRDALVGTIETHLTTSPDDLRAAPQGSEFLFMSSRSLILPTAHEARSLEEFGQALRKVSLHSIYHHVFEARLRMERGNDFSHWLGLHGEQELAWQITLLDPYTQTLESLRRRMVRLVEKRLEDLRVPA